MNVAKIQFLTPVLTASGQASLRVTYNQYFIYATQIIAIRISDQCYIEHFLRLA